MRMREPSTGRPRNLGLILCLGTIAGCGPAPEEIAGSVLSVLPVAYVVCLLLVIGLARRWAPRVPEADIDWLRPWQAVGVSALCLLGVVAAEPGIVALAAWTVTGLLAGCACLLARIGIALRAPELIRWSAAGAALVVALVHALVFVLEPAAGRAITDAGSAVFWFVGRWLGPVVAVVLVCEAAIRNPR
ncbi:MAG: hypothetical protein R6X02_11095 [Enhygromyxa sp.]